MLDSVRELKHSRQPIFKRNTRRFSYMYKIFDKESFRRLLNEQDVLQFRPGALFRNHEEVADITDMVAEEALELAKQRARNRTEAKPMSQSIIEIGIGEGRCTRSGAPLVAWFILFLSVRKAYRQVFCKEYFNVRSEKRSCRASFDYLFFNNRELRRTMKAVLFDCKSTK